MAARNRKQKIAGPTATACPPIRIHRIIGCILVGGRAATGGAASIACNILQPNKFGPNVGFQVGYVFEEDNWPTWVESDAWAPEVHSVNGSYYVYYSARKADGFHGIGVAFSAYSESPFGPYVDTGKLLVEYGNQEAIDPTYFFDQKTGKHFLIWKDKLTSIVIRELSLDGVTFAPKSKMVTLLKASNEEDDSCIEGPWMIFRYVQYSISTYRGIQTLEYYYKSQKDWMNIDKILNHTLVYQIDGSVRLFIIPKKVPRFGLISFGSAY